VGRGRRERTNMIFRPYQTPGKVFLESFGGREGEENLVDEKGGGSWTKISISKSGGENKVLPLLVDGRKGPQRE